MMTDEEIKARIENPTPTYEAKFFEDGKLVLGINKASFKPEQVPFMPDSDATLIVEPDIYPSGKPIKIDGDGVANFEIPVNEATQERVYFVGIQGKSISGGDVNYYSFVTYHKTNIRAEQPAATPNPTIVQNPTNTSTEKVADNPDNTPKRTEVQPKTTSVEVVVDSKPQDNSFALGVGIGLLIALLCVVAILLYRKHKKRKPTK